MATKTSPDTKARIVVLRAAGYSLPLIAKDTGVSVSTIKRVLKDHPPATGENQLDLVECARTELRAQFNTNDAVGDLYASLLADTIYHIESSREIASAALEKLKASDVKDAALVFRALTAHSTALKSHVDCLKALAPPPEIMEELPVLRVISMTGEEEEAMRKAHREESDLLESGYD